MASRLAVAPLAAAVFLCLCAPALAADRGPEWLPSSTTYAVQAAPGVQVGPSQGKRAQVPLGVLQPRQLGRIKRAAAKRYRRHGGRKVSRRARVAAGGDAFGPEPGAVVSGTLNWAGLQFATGSPPDTTGAIGPSHYVEMVNSTVAAYDRTNGSQVGATATLRTLTGSGGADNVFDPQIIYDPTTSRWYYAMDRIVGASNFLSFGWSKTTDPSSLDSTGWCQYHLATGTEFDDYPKLGDNATHIIIGVNVFGPSSFLTSRIHAIPKPGPGNTCPAQPAAVSTPPIGSGSSQVLTNANTSPAFTPTPANSFGNDANGWVTAAAFSNLATRATKGAPGGGSTSAPGFGNFLMTWKVNPDGTVTQNGHVAVPTYRMPAPVPQPNVGCAAPKCDTLDSLDSRITQAVSATDPAVGETAVWTQHTVDGPGGRSAVRWYELLPARCASNACGTDATRQSGAIADRDHFVFNGAISPTSAGDAAVINYNVGSETLDAEIRARSRRASSPLGAMVGEITIAGSAGSNDDFTCGSRDLRASCRWGDYAGASPDPANDGLVWGSNQWLANTAGGAGTWRTQNFALAPNATGELVESSTEVRDSGGGGDGDGAAEPGETVNLRTLLQNAGDTAATGVNGTLSPVTAGVTVGSSGSSYGDFAPAETRRNASPLTITIGGGVACGTPIDLSLSAAGSQGTNTIPIRLSSGAAGAPFTTTQATPAGIPDSNATGVTSSLTVSDGSNARVKDVNVRIDSITHPFIGDLRIEITGPDGTTVLLANRPGGSTNSNANIANLTFDDEAVNEQPGSPASLSNATFLPLEQLARFDGRPQNGTWTLRVSDRGSSDVGTLNSWAAVNTPAVCAVGTPPAATIDGPADALSNTPTTFTGGGTPSPGATGPTQFEWDPDGDGEYEAASSSPTRQISFATLGVQTIGLRVTDSNGNKAETTKQVAVTNAPPTPTLVATPASVLTSDPVVLDASGSADPDGGALTYAWDLDGDTANGFETPGGSTATISHSFPTPGTRSVRVQVTDPPGGSAVATASVEVLNRAPTAGLVSTPASVLTSDPVVLDASGSADPEGGALTYAWDLDGDTTNGFETAGGSTATISRAFPTPGTRSVRVQVTDSLGASAVATASVEVQNRAPVAGFTISANPVSTGQSVAFDATLAASDVDGDVVRHEWDLDGDSANGFETDTGETSATATTYTSAGARTVRLRVTDNSGATAVASQLITVNAAVVPRDTTAPKLTLKLPGVTLARLLARGIAPTAGCDEPCVITLKLVLPAAQAKKFGLGRKNKTLATRKLTLAAAGSKVGRLKPGRRVRRKLRNAQSVKFRLSVTAVDLAGNATPATRKFSARRPRS